MRKAVEVCLALAAGALLGILSLLPPPPQPPGAGFSALRAQADLRILAAAPHHVWDQEGLERVRNHLRNRLRGLGLEVTEHHHPEVTDRFGHRYPLVNFSVSLPGRSGSSVLLVSHYDSAPPRKGWAGVSRGAADDGFGVAAMLEIAERLAADPEPRVNGVRFLFTDAEETGLLGARAELERHPEAWRDVNLVINLEARGVRGPAGMFETGAGNAPVIGLLRRAHRPFSYSFAPDVYRRMPNGTDFTVFLRAGYPGMNFAVLDDLSEYHTWRDDMEHASLASLQHFGDQVLPMVRACLRDPALAGPDAFRGRSDMVFFSWVPGVFLAWPRAWDLAAAAALAALALGWAALQAARGRVRVPAILGWALGWLGLAAGAGGLGLAVAWLLAKVTRQPFRFTYLPNVPGGRIVTWALVALLAAAAYRLARRGRGRGPLLGALAVHLVGLGLTAAWLPGTTFLVSVPAALALAAAALGDRLGSRIPVLVALTLMVSLHLPVLHLVGLALTPGALGALLPLAALPAALGAALVADLNCR